MNIDDIMSRSLYYDKNGKPMEMMAWVEKMRDEDYRRVGQTKIGKFVISTVWLGLDHSFGHGDPIIFETMVFPSCEDMWRYCTLAQAVAGHALKVAEYTALVSQNVSHLPEPKDE